MGDGRHQGDPIDPLGSDLGSETHGVSAFHQHGGRATEVGPQGTEHQHVEDGQGQCGAVALAGNGRVGPSTRDAGPQQVVLGVHGALGSTSSTRCVGNGCRGLRVDVGGGRRVSGVNQIGPRSRSVGRVDHEEVPVGGASVKSGSPEAVRPVIGGHQQVDLGVVERPRHLVGRQIGVDAQPDGPKSLGGQEGLDEGDPVGERAGHPVSGPDAQGGQASGCRGHPGIQFGVGQRLPSVKGVSVDQCLSVGMVPHPGRQGLGGGGRALGQRSRMVTDH